MRGLWHAQPGLAAAGPRGNARREGARSVRNRPAPAVLGDNSEMSRISGDQVRKKLDEAEGYLMLDLPRRSLQILESQPDWLNMQFEACLLKGEALGSLNRYRDALRHLEVAAALRQGNSRVALALGWCYKRTNRLAQAIDSLERAIREHPDEALLHYNLACYWSLAANTPKALEALTLALELDPRLHALVTKEADFDSLRGDPKFERLVKGCAHQPEP